MRRTPGFSGLKLSMFTLATWLTAGVVGCANQPAAQPEPPEPARSTPKSREITPTRLAKGEEPLDDEALSVHERLIEAMKGNETPASPDPAVAEKNPTKGGIDWVGNDQLRTANPPKVEPVVPPPAPVKPAEKKDDAGTVVAKPQAADPVKPQPATTVNAQPDRDAIIKLIHDRVNTSGDPAVAKAMSLAAIALVDPSFKLDEKELAALPPTQRELVKQFLDLFSTISQQVQDGKAVDRTALADRMNAIVGEQPLSIRTIKLCDRVRGFGVYEELPSDTFLAGREQPMVVYVELDHFKSVKAGESFQVKLTQELVLYNESDGLAVWRQPEEQIVDESRNKRRDFYVVQPTRLPARLGVGKYVLKIRVRDVLGGTRDEVSLPVNVVADPALVKPDVKKNASKPG